jgi:oxepin-CoA hydrolase/3-oxo-5,6-dehydrosuberyl-CoA semialdehyde dehydrogenase
MNELESFLEGKWVKGSGKESVLVNPSTEEPLAIARTGGLDFGKALSHARRKGGPALRGMSFAARGELLRALSRAIHAHRDELIGLAIANGGNTRSDAKFDIDGASGTLAAYADLGAEIGDTHVLVDGEGIALGRSARLFGNHAFVPREGVAVHVNAFNFPAWGLAEKAAAAWLAGMPVVSKPATSTALVAHRIAKILADEKLLPEGAFAFVAGGAGDLLEHLEGQDVLAFTGSSATGQALRAGKAVLAHSVRVNVEADSLNAAVLGPDLDADGDGSEAFGLFIADVVRDMTQKTGQKCTAIRRVYVPKAKVDLVVAKLSERLAAVKTGDPAREDATMGPLATRQQEDDVRAGTERLAKAGKIVFGSLTASDAKPGGKGYFFPPVLLRSEAPERGDAVHTHEVFGPVATVMPYEGTARDAAEKVAWGGGGLVASVYTDDRAFAKEAVLGIAAHHGRVTLGSSKIAGQAIPPGTVLPQLVHGGPGRAGSGEELGGRRGLAFSMQRVALQGDRAMLEAILGKR